MPQEPPTSRPSSRASRRVSSNESLSETFDDLVADRAVVGLGPEVLADPLDQVRPAGAPGVDRTLGVGADDPHPTAGGLLEVPAGAGDRAAGANARDEVRDPPAGLLPDLGSGGLVVRLRDCPGSRTGWASRRPGSPGPGGRRPGSTSGGPPARPRSGRRPPRRRSALRTLRLSSLTLSGQTKTQRYPLRCATRASPTPVLPLVGSTIVPPGRRRPAFSASSTIRRAMRSLTLPPGLKYSTLARTVAWIPSVTLCSRTSGVLPISSTTLSK